MNHTVGLPIVNHNKCSCVLLMEFLVYFILVPHWLRYILTSCNSHEVYYSSLESWETVELKSNNKSSSLMDTFLVMESKLRVSNILPQVLKTSICYGLSPPDLNWYCVKQSVNQCLMLLQCEWCSVQHVKNWGAFKLISANLNSKLISFCILLKAKPLEIKLLYNS